MAALGRRRGEQPGQTGAQRRDCQQAQEPAWSHFAISLVSNDVCGIHHPRDDAPVPHAGACHPQARGVRCPFFAEAPRQSFRSGPGAARCSRPFRPPAASCLPADWTALVGRSTSAACVTGYIEPFPIYPEPCGGNRETPGRRSLPPRPEGRGGSKGPGCPYGASDPTGTICASLSASTARKVSASLRARREMPVTL